MSFLESSMTFLFLLISDFFAFEDCPYIIFGDLHFVNASSTSSSLISQHICIASKVWKRKEIAKSLELSEEHFVDLCIVLGNDFSSHYSPLDFDHLHGLVSTSGSRHFSIAEHIEIIRHSEVQLGDTFRVSSKNEVFLTMLTLNLFKELIVTIYRYYTSPH